MDSKVIRRAHFAQVFVSVLPITLAACGGGGGGSNSQSASEAPDAPDAGFLSVESVYPAQGSVTGGTLIELRGRGFSSDTQVKIGDQDCDDVTFLSASAITCTTPSHPRGPVIVEAISAEGERATLIDAFNYRPSGTGMASFGILAATPLPGVYPAAFTGTLESVLSGFDLKTASREWIVNGRPKKEGDRVTFSIGTHTVELAVHDASGDVDTISYSIIVGPQLGEHSPDISQQSTEGASDAFALDPSRTISLVNTGLFPLLNPRFVGENRPDYVDWPRYLKSLAGLQNLPLDASEASRVSLLEAAWKDLSNTTKHICSPGRESEHIYDPVMLVRGYGYECCSNAARALAYIGSFLDIPSRVRSTVEHEYPEFVAGGRMFILDPDLRVRFWNANQEPLSGWTSENAPESLENVTHYYAETPSGGYHEVNYGESLPFSAHAEQAFRAFYFNNVVGETIWGYNEAFSNSDYLLYPNEKIAFRQSSNYVPLQWMRGDGTPEGGQYAPPVGKVLLRMLWSKGGARSFKRDAVGNALIPLQDLPYPVQDLTFYFSKTALPQSAWIVAGGKSHRIGEFSANTWTISAEQLRALSDLSGLAAAISSDANVVVVEAGMQFNPRIFGSSGDNAVVTYADDSGDCRREINVISGADVKGMSLGDAMCDPHAPQRVKSSFALTLGASGVSVISNYGNSYQGTWGVVARAGSHAYADISLPRTSGLPGLLRVSNEGFFADWQILDGSDWTPVADLATTQWIQLPATTSPTTRLRVTLRQPLAEDRTYLSYLSLLEGRDVDFFVAATNNSADP